jgi:uncharacterized protein (TIGR03663 family)
MRPAGAVARPSDVSVATTRLADVRDRVLAWIRDASPFLAVAGFALALRLFDLDVKPYHHDESLHAWFAWRLVSGDGYSYDPVYHGPVQFYLIALANLLLGVGDYTARVPVATVGAVTVFLPYFLRRQLGTVAALTASAAVCLSPSFLYVSRFAREDTHVAAATLGLIVVLVRFFDQPRRWHPPALLALLAVAFAAKETTYISVFVTGLFLAGVTLVQALRARRAGRPLRDAGLVASVRTLGDAWAWGAAAFLVTFTLLFSTFLTNPGGLQEGLWGSIDYWLSQQPVNRGGQPWFYYLALIPAYEWPLVLFGIAGVVAVVRRPSLAGAFLVWLFAATLAAFSWASERMPWLVIHPLCRSCCSRESARRRCGVRAAGCLRESRSCWGSSRRSVQPRPPSASRTPAPPTRASCSCRFRPQATCPRSATSSCGSSRRTRRLRASRSCSPSTAGEARPGPGCGTCATSPRRTST